MCVEKVCTYSHTVISSSIPVTISAPATFIIQYISTASFIFWIITPTCFLSLLFIHSRCVVFFGFQRCVWHFVDPLAAKDGPNTSNPASLMVLGREKTRVQPLVTKVPKLANVPRNSLSLGNVKLENRDGPLLEQFSAACVKKGWAPDDILYYQMLFQVWRNQPGLRAPRSIIITKARILLCSEDLHSDMVQFGILESYLLKDVFKVYLEEDKAFVTIVFKASGVFAGRKKWRLTADSAAISARVLEEYKRACAEN